MGDSLAIAPARETLQGWWVEHVVDGFVASARVDVQEIWEGRQIGLVPCSDTLCMRGWKCFVFCFFLI